MVREEFHLILGPARDITQRQVIIHLACQVIIHLTRMLYVQEGEY